MYNGRIHARTHNVIAVVNPYNDMINKIMGDFINSQTGQNEIPKHETRLQQASSFSNSTSRSFYLYILYIYHGI